MMEKRIRHYSPDASAGDNPGARGSNVISNLRMSEGNEDPATSDDYDEGGMIGDGITSESGVPEQGDDLRTITGTDRDKTEPDENMATES